MSEKDFNDIFNEAKEKALTSFQKSDTTKSISNSFTKMGKSVSRSFAPSLKRFLDFIDDEPKDDPTGIYPYYKMEKMKKDVHKQVDNSKSYPIIGGITCILLIATLYCLLSGHEIGAFLSGSYFLLCGVFYIVMSSNYKKSKAEEDKMNRFYTYLSIIGNREYCSFSELINGVHMTKHDLEYDLSQMIYDRWFYHAHLIHDKELFCITDESYSTLLEEAQANAKQVKEKMKQDPLSPETRKMVERAKEYQHEIANLEILLDNSSMSLKMTSLDTVLNEIISFFDCNDSYNATLRKMNRYYLPTTLKLLNSYNEMKDSDVATRIEIESALDDLIDAYNKILEEITQNKRIDLLAEITVLHDVLAKDGYSDHDKIIN